MNLKYLAISIVILFTNTHTNPTFQESKTDILCSGKWYMVSMESSSSKMKVPNYDKKNMWMIFSKDGKHEVNAKNGQKKTEIGRWEFTKNKDSIIFNTEIGNIKKMKLKSLTKKELGLSFNEYGKEISIYLEKEEEEEEEEEEE